MWKLSANPDSLNRADLVAYRECAEIANLAMNNNLPNHIGDAVLYHDTSIGKPWGEAAQFVKQIDDLIFYREIIIYKK